VLDRSLVVPAFAALTSTGLHRTAHESRAAFVAVAGRHPRPLARRAANAAVKALGGDEATILAAWAGGVGASFREQRLHRTIRQLDLAGCGTVRPELLQLVFQGRQLFAALSRRALAGRPARHVPDRVATAVGVEDHAVDRLVGRGRGRTCVDRRDLLATAARDERVHGARVLARLPFRLGLGLTYSRVFAAASHRVARSLPAHVWVAVRGHRKIVARATALALSLDIPRRVSHPIGPIL